MTSKNTATNYAVRLFHDDNGPCCEHVECSTEKEARAEAARLLGHRTLRGASQWDASDYDVATTVFRFGPHTEQNGYDFVRIERR